MTKQKIKLILGRFILLFLIINYVSSLECTDNNNFIIGDDINICTDGCVYQTEVDGVTYFPCDSTVKCKFTAFYSNKSTIVQDVLMTRNGSVFNYDLPNSLGVGVYHGFISCNRDKGFYSTDFEFTISETPLATSSSSSYYIQDSKLDNIVVSFQDLLFDFNNKIYVETKDKYNQRVNINNLTTNILSNINYTSSYKKLDDGYYEITLNVPKQQVPLTYLKIEAITVDKTLTKTETLNFEDKTFSNVITGYTFAFSNSGKYAFLIKNSSYILYIILGILLLAFILLLIKYKRQK